MRLPIVAPHRPGNPDDSLIPLINIVFLMLIFFMIAGHITSARLPGDLQLPGSTRINPAQRGYHVLAVNTSGQMTVDQTPVTAEALEKMLQEWMLDDPDLSLQLCLDQELDAATLTPLLKQLRTLGLHKVMLISAPVAAP